MGSRYCPNILAVPLCIVNVGRLSWAALFNSDRGPQRPEPVILLVNVALFKTNFLSIGDASFVVRNVFEEDARELTSGIINDFSASLGCGISIGICTRFLIDKILCRLNI